MLNDSGPVLIVDDNNLEVLLVKKSFSRLNLNKKIDRVSNGLEAVQYLESGMHPSIILLDLNMPVMNGLEFLEKRIENPDWLQIPVVILSASHDQSDKESSLRQGACGYMIKPIDFVEMTKMLKAIMDYWSLSEVIE